MLRSAVWRLPNLLLVLAALGLLAGACVSVSSETTETEAEASEAQAIEGLPPEFARLAEVWEILQREHIDGANINPQTVSDGAIRGMLASLDDPYAAYLDREQFPLERQDIRGFFEGIGAEVGMKEGHVTVLAPMPDSPAEEAGIRPGDMILAVDGEDIRGLSLLEVIHKIRGEAGTTVRLSVRRLNGVDTVEIAIERGRITLRSVNLLMQVGGIGHLKLSGFTGATNDELKAALERFERSQGVGMVVDLRNNPGGLVSSVVDVTSQFVDEGLVLYQIDAKGHRRDWEVEPGGLAHEIPVVVLVNEFSASASEVFAGAIIDHERAPVVGVATFGKGSVNNLWPLSDGSGINVTTARWYTPSGTLIEGEGIIPDIVEEPSEDELEDPQLDRAIELLQQEIAKVR